MEQYSEYLMKSSRRQYCSSWEVEELAFAGDGDVVGGFVWPPARSYSCSFCTREFRSAQALGGHMNVHRRQKANLQTHHHTTTTSLPVLAPQINHHLQEEKKLLMKNKTTTTTTTTLYSSDPPPPPAAAPPYNNNNRGVISSILPPALAAGRGSQESSSSCDTITTCIYDEEVQVGAASIGGDIVETNLVLGFGLDDDSNCSNHVLGGGGKRRRKTTCWNHPMILTTGACSLDMLDLELRLA